MVVFFPKNYEFEISRLICILFEYWKVDVNKNVGICALESEKFISTLCLFSVIILICPYVNFHIKQPNYLQPSGSGSAARRRVISLPIRSDLKTENIALVEIGRIICSHLRAYANIFFKLKLFCMHDTVTYNLVGINSTVH